MTARQRAVPEGHSVNPTPPEVRSVAEKRRETVDDFVDWLLLILASYNREQLPEWPTGHLEEHFKDLLNCSPAEARVILAYAIVRQACYRESPVAKAPRARLEQENRPATE